GGWQADGKGASIWDTFCHQQGRVFGDQNGDVSCNSCQLWDQDLACVRQLGLTHYRLSFSWARLLPDGTTGTVNPKGVQYYNRVIDDLLACNVSPMVTLYHFDLPQALQDQGGWAWPGIAGLFDSTLSSASTCSATASGFGSPSTSRRCAPNWATKTASTRRGGKSPGWPPTWWAITCSAPTPRPGAATTPSTGPTPPTLPRTASPRRAPSRLRMSSAQGFTGTPLLKWLKARLLRRTE
ncbi:unnamed protein product, partial [Tetraodon nigroviridis]